MKLPRRIFLRLTAGAAALPAVSRIAMAQVYPSGPVRLIVGFPGGTTGDILMRLMGQWLSDRLGQPFIIENRPGAAGNVATDQVVRAAPDGYTLLLAVPANAINASLYDNLNFNFIDDMVPVADGLCGPRNTPTEVANKLHETTNLALADPKLKARLADLVVEPMPMRPVQLGKFIADETEKWGKVIRAARIKAG